MFLIYLKAVLFHSALDCNQPNGYLPRPEGARLVELLARRRIPLGICPSSNLILRTWRVRIGRVTLYLLDSNVPENRPEDRPEPALVLIVLQ